MQDNCQLKSQMKPPNLDLNTISTNFKINKHKIRKNFA